MNLFREGFSAEAFLLCVAAGALTAAGYDLLRFFRVLFAPGRCGVLLLDFAFCLFAATVAFFVSLPVSFGRLRLFQLASEAMGATVYALLLGQVTGRLAGLLRRCAQKLFGLLHRCGQRLFGRFRRGGQKLRGRLCARRAKKKRPDGRKKRKKVKKDFKKRRSHP